MTSKYFNVLHYIDATDSVSKIIEMATIDEKFYGEMKKCKINKFLEPFDAIFKLVIYKGSCFDITKCELDFSDYANFYSANKSTIKVLHNKKDIDLETQTDIIVENTADLKIKNELERLSCAEKYAQIITYLLEKFTFASKLTIFNGEGMEKTDDFILLVVEKTKSTKLECLSPIWLHSIITFTSKYDISEHDIFTGKPNLKIFTIYVSSSKIFEDQYLLTKNFWKFIDSLHEKNIQLKLIFELNERSIFLTVTILKYSKKNNINVLVETENDKVNFFNRIEKGIARKDFELIGNLSSVTLIINTFADFLYMKDILIVMTKLENLKIIFNRIIYSNIYKTNIKLDDIRKIYHNIFNFKILVDTLKCVTLEYQDNYYPDIFDTFNFSNNLYDLFITSFFSILPKFTTIIKFYNLPCLKEESFECLYENTPNLNTIVFKHCKYLPDEPLLLFRNLRNVLFINNIGVTIPSWVEIVVHREFNDYMCKNFFWPYVGKNNKEFYRLMRNCTLKHTFWLDKNCISDTVIFMKDVLKWKIAINLLHL